ncbi:hypothetical protein SVAN01_08501 [Stagonosporopsis vannaccii]|nr:hypothetical protein SVAN01_08501 [Stagonosporopsis vannaccii]
MAMHVDAGRPGPARSAVHRKLHSWTFLPFLQFFGGGIYAPDPSTYDPIEILLNAESEDERDGLTARWRDNKLSELNFVGVVSALLAGVLTSTGSWPSILPSGEVSPWPIRTTWYCGIVLSLFSILTAADQTVRLHRLSSHRDGLANLRKLLSKSLRARKADEEAGEGRLQHRVQPSLLQVVTWQMPVMFLTSATICMTVGLFLHVWSATPHFGRTGEWDDDSKVAVTYTVVAIIAILLFCVGQFALYSPIRK